MLQLPVSDINIRTEMTYIQNRTQIESAASVGSLECHTPPRLQLVDAAHLRAISCNAKKCGVVHGVRRKIQRGDVLFGKKSIINRPNRPNFPISELGETLNRTMVSREDAYS